MPFTFAHPAASIPLYRPLRRFGVLSALVIGSFSPDLIYFLPIGIIRSESHSFPGIFWFGLPVGIIIYVLFHVLLKGPLLGLLPEFVFSRLGNFAERYHSFPPVSWVAVIVSLLCGTITHFLWDSFTHWDGFAVKAIPVLTSQVFSVEGYPVYLLKLLQQVSTCVGLLLIGFWLWRWLKNTPQNRRLLPVILSQSQRIIAGGAILITPLFIGVGAGAFALYFHEYENPLKVFADIAVSTALPTFLLMVVAYSCGWHLWRLRRRSTSDLAI